MSHNQRYRGEIDAEKSPPQLWLNITPFHKQDAWFQRQKKKYSGTATP
jgi:hypothetical protein